jgi:hypothetical protein
MYPAAGWEWGWQYVFPAAGLLRDPPADEVRLLILREGRARHSVRAAESGEIAQIRQVSGVRGAHGVTRPPLRSRCLRGVGGLATRLVW